MKIKKSVLERIIREELAAHISSLTEAPDVQDAQDDNERKEKAPPKQPDKKPSPQTKKEPEEQPADSDGEGDEDKLEKDAEEAEDAAEVTGGKIAKEITGKTIQSVTMEPKSKILPGSQEIVVTFDQIPDPLRILVSKTGDVKFYFKGLHNEL